jgi:hypothetical protein
MSFNCDVAAGNVICTAEHILETADIGRSAFIDLAHQWLLQGTMSNVPTSAAIILLGSGLIGLVVVVISKRLSR